VSVIVDEMEAGCRYPDDVDAISDLKDSTTMASFNDFSTPLEEVRSVKGTRVEMPFRERLAIGDDGGVFSGLATTTFCLEVVYDLVGVLGASSKALTKIDMESKLKKKVVAKNLKKNLIQDRFWTSFFIFTLSTHPHHLFVFIITARTKYI
jgi:hypothetical protein